MFKPNKLRAHDGDFGDKMQPKYGDPFGTYRPRLYGVYKFDKGEVLEFLIDQSVIYDIGGDADRDNIYWYGNG